MDNASKLLSEVVAFRTYAKYLPHLQRRESFEETINRTMTSHLDKFPKLSKDVIKAFQKVHEYKVMPSMRYLQFSGEAINRNNIRGFNCSAVAVTNSRVFGEILFLLLSGTGVGFSVQSHHINQLPVIKQPKEENMFIVHDSIEGWAQALDVLIEAYFFQRIRPVFDFSFVRQKGAYLSTTGAKAPGPEPLKLMLAKVEDKLRLAIGRKLKSIEVHDIVCIISDCVLAGGIRRSSLISLFDKNDQEMLKAKTGEWWNISPWRARANNSAVLVRENTSKEEFDTIFEITKNSNSGEPGFFFTNSQEIGGNPCMEIALDLQGQFCNLSSINLTAIEDKKDFLSAVYSATLIGTLQASYTNFPYLRDNWKDVTERDALLGVSFTGIADYGNKIKNDWLEDAAAYALEINEKYAKKIGINLAARIGCVKPEGTLSTIVGSSSGIHARHAEYYIRRVRMVANDSLAIYLKYKVPELMEEDKFTANTLILSVPQESPTGALTRDGETALSLLDRTVTYSRHWIRNSYRSGLNHHNVSVTISVKENEWENLKEALWLNKDYYNGISILPYDGGHYEQAPFEKITQDQYKKLCESIKEIDLREVKEELDYTDRMSIQACAGGACDII